MTATVKVDDTIRITKIIFFAEGEVLATGESTELRLEPGNRGKVLAVGDEYNGGVGCVQFEIRGCAVWVGPDQYEVC